MKEKALNLKSRSQLVPPLRTRKLITSGFDLSPDNSLYTYKTHGVPNNYSGFKVCLFALSFFVVVNDGILRNEKKHSCQ